MSVVFSKNVVFNELDMPCLKDKPVSDSPSGIRMSGTIPTQSSKASTAATDDMEITNYNELNGNKIEKCHTGTGIPVPYPGPWRVGSGSRILYPGGYGSGSGSKFHYKGTGPSLGVP
ncbi:hypothetical protein M9H77_11990 [Catharanthus roseus]|uniref:Uncharacterized protein n=1 Tax=Catharanthus roseus TaxID=4058 RepID=A0ACC0BG28_CATRO|nr:hypothetical protein M9H77_11990 [Catharanthus roseus]